MPWTQLSKHSSVQQWDFFFKIFQIRFFLSANFSFKEWKNKREKVPSRKYIILFSLSTPDVCKLALLSNPVAACFSISVLEWLIRNGYIFSFFNLKFFRVLCIVLCCQNLVIEIVNIGTHKRKKEEIYWCERIQIDGSILMSWG